ncbi:hypothetical protein WMY93_028219 [Mugilogobius chulae]|uniref:Uncharacterized protein n=1 Tax=Mugilogobius chulae TaxID=88201 RepID=A0AAW0MPM2_9GOBI
MDHYPAEHHEGGGYDSDGWGPPMPVQTYLHQGMEDELEEEDERVPTPPIRGVASSPAAVSFGQQSTATLTPSPRDEMQPMLQAHLDELTRVYQMDMAKQAWHMQAGSLPPQAPAPPVGYVSSTMVSELETDLPEDEEEEEDEEDEGYGARHPRGLEHTPGSSMDNLDSSLTGKALSHRPRPSSPFSTDGSTGGSHSLGNPRAPRAQRKGRTPGTTPHRRDPAADDLPPPPEPPPCQGPGRIQGARSVGSVVAPGDRKASSLERPPMSGPLEHHRQVQERLGSMDRSEDARRTHKTEDPCVPYSKPSFPSPGPTALQGPPPPKAPRAPGRATGPGSLSSGPLWSTPTSWGPTDRDTSQESYSNLPATLRRSCCVSKAVDGLAWCEACAWGQHTHCKCGVQTQKKIPLIHS